MHISDEVAVDVDGQGDAVGVEFLLAPADLAADVSKALFERFPAVRRALSEFQAIAVV